MLVLLLMIGRKVFMRGELLDHSAKWGFRLYQAIENEKSGILQIEGGMKCRKKGEADLWA